MALSKMLEYQDYPEQWLIIHFIRRHSAICLKFEPSFVITATERNQNVCSIDWFSVSNFIILMWLRSSEQNTIKIDINSWEIHKSINIQHNICAFVTFIFEQHLTYKHYFLNPAQIHKINNFGIFFPYTRFNFRQQACVNSLPTIQVNFNLNEANFFPSTYIYECGRERKSTQMKIWKWFHASATFHQTLYFVGCSFFSPQDR